MPDYRFSDTRRFLFSGLILLTSFLSPSVMAQSTPASGVSSGSSTPSKTIQRVTSTPRSDGLGYVIRLHTEAVIDSFFLVQSEPEVIQILLFSDGLSIQSQSNQVLSQPLQSVSPTQLPVGLGIDLILSKETPFKSRMYRDQNGRDLLIALEKTSELEMELLTDGIPRIDWGRRFANEKTEQQGESSSEATTAQRKNGNGSGGASGTANNNSGRILSGNQTPSGEDASYAQIRENLKFDVVVLDAGHGGHDPGSLGYGGVREKDIALSVTKKVGKYIETYLPEVKVVYTRSNDTFVELHERGSIANRAEGDLFVSIHCNAFTNRNANGAEVFFLGLAKTDDALETMKKENSVLRFEENSAKTELTEEEILIYELANAGYLQNSQILATSMEYQFNQRARRRSRGVKQAGFMVLYHASMPAILVELGFISNPNEAKYLSGDYGQDIMASAIFRAIRDFKVEYDASLSTLGGNSSKSNTSE